MAAENSVTFQDKNAEKAIDLDLDTQSVASKHGETWFKVMFDGIKCIRQVTLYNTRGKHTWTCSNMDCSSCKGKACLNVAATVEMETTESNLNLPATKDCKYGDIVRMKQNKEGTELGIKEIAVVGVSVEQESEQGSNVYQVFIGLKLREKMFP